MSTVHSYTNDQPIHDFPHKGTCGRARAGCREHDPHHDGRGHRGSASCCPSSRASSTASPSACPPPMSPSSTSRPELGQARPRSRAVNDRVPGGGGRTAARDPRRDRRGSWSRWTSTAIPTPRSSICRPRRSSTAISSRCSPGTTNEWGYSSRVRDLIRLIGKTPLGPWGSSPSSRWISRGAGSFLRADLNAPLEGGRDRRRHPIERRSCRRSSTRLKAGSDGSCWPLHLGRPKGTPDPE